MIPRAALASTALALAALTAGAAEAAVSVRYVRGPDALACAPVDDLAARLRASADESFAGSPDRAVRILVGREEAGFLATVRFESGDGEALGERVLRSADCDDLLDAVVLTITLGLEATVEPAPGSDGAAPGTPADPATPHGAPPDPASPHGAPPDPAPPDGAPTPTTATPTGGPASPPSPPRFASGRFLTTAVTARVGTAPAPVVGLFVGPQLGTHAWALSLGLFGDLPGSGAAGPGRVALGRAGAELGVCPRFGALGLCATAAAGAAWISGRELYGARTVARLFAEVGLRATLRLRGGLTAGMQLASPLLRLEVVDGVGGEVFWKSPPLSGGLYVGVDLPL